MKSVKIIDKEMKSSGFLKVEGLQLQVPKYDEEGSFTQQRELVVQSDSVFLLPYDPVTKEVVVVTQHRPGAAYELSSEVIETIAGRVDKSLSYEEIVIAEAKEEAGLDVCIDDIEKIGTFYLSPGASTEKAHVYLVEKSLSDVPSRAVHGLPEEGENILMEKKPLKELLDTDPSKAQMSAILMMSLMAVRSR